MRRGALAIAVVAAICAARVAAADVFVDVALVVDIEKGVATGELRRDGETSTPIDVSLPKLGPGTDPFSGYIGPESALLPPQSGWLPPLRAGEAGWRITVATNDGFVAAPYPGGQVQVNPDGAATTGFSLRRELARAPLAIGRYQVAERRHGDVVLRTFFTERNKAHADAYLDAAAEAIDVLSDRIGAYPYEAFSVVESPLPVGLGYPGFTLVSGRILPFPFMRGRSLWHEISHVWWGNAVWSDYENGNWAEGFATFFADYALAERNGPEAAREMRYDWLLEFDALAPADDIPLRRFVTKTHGHAQSIGYGKAAMLLVMLRDKMGEAAFDAGVKRFWSKNQFRRAGWPEIEAAFEAAHGAPLDDFFKRWLDRPGAAPADISDRDFRVFRRLDDRERISTLRRAINAATIEVFLLDGAPGDRQAIENALSPVGAASAGGFPIYVGDRAAVEAALEQAPPKPGSAMWATRDADGREAVAIAASDLSEVARFARGLRHYGRWSWVAAATRGRPERGRWTPALN